MEEQDIWNSMMPVETGRPKGLLYHYTTPDGLRGILQDDNLRATHIRFLNDWSEHQEAFYRKNTDALVSSLAPGANDSIMKNINEKLPNILRECDIFIISFSDDQYAFPEDSSRSGNRLSQWRSYSNESGGYSLGFDYDQLANGWEKCNLKRTGGAPWIRQCVYSDDQKKNTAQLIGNSGYKCLQLAVQHKIAKFKNGNGRSPNQQESSAILSECILPALSTTSTTYFLDAARFKHEGFSEEHEWRMVFYVKREKLLKAHRDRPDDPIIRLRTGRYGLTPYIEYPLILGSDIKSLRRIVVGPCPHPEEAENAVHLLLATNGIHGVEVVPSKIPYRNW